MDFRFRYTNSIPRTAFHFGGYSIRPQPKTLSDITPFDYNPFISSFNYIPILTDERSPIQPSFNKRSSKVQDAHPFWSKKEQKARFKKSDLELEKKFFPIYKKIDYIKGKMEWTDETGQIFCGSQAELHASNPSWQTLTGTTPASLKCQAATVAPIIQTYYPELFSRVRPSFDLYLRESGVWWEPGPAMLFNAKLWLEFQPFLRDYQNNAERITDLGMARFRKLANLAQAGVARITQVEHNPHAPSISLMATPKEAAELLATFPTADSVVAQALWRSPFGCDYLLQILVKLIQLTVLKYTDWNYVNVVPEPVQEFDPVSTSCISPRDTQPHHLDPEYNSDEEW